MTASEPRQHAGTPVFAYDLARATAAFAVLAAHARGFVFADLPQQPALPLLGRLFFGVTSVGHQAVIVFLVLSGVLVTGSVLTTLDTGRWSAALYVVTRLNRLWVVLLPCLAIGGLEDAVGLLAFDPHGLGSYGAEASAQAVMDRLDGVTLAGNILFLQDFKVPVFGSNVPLWSLSIEAWCYAALFGSVVLWTARTQVIRLGCTVVAIAAVAAGALSPTFWAICPVWGAGAALAVWFRASRQSERPSPFTRLASALDWRHAGGLLLVVAAVAMARMLATHHLPLSDYLLTIAIVAALAVLRDWQPPVTRWRRWVERGAGFSYTLYLAHFPLLALLDAAVLGHHRLAWGGPAVAIWIAAVGLAVLQALALWWLFERHTGTLRMRFVTALEGGTRRLPTTLPTVRS